MHELHDVAVQKSTAAIKTAQEFENKHESALEKIEVLEMKISRMEELYSELSEMGEELTKLKCELCELRTPRPSRNLNEEHDQQIQEFKEKWKKAEMELELSVKKAAERRTKLLVSVIEISTK